MNDRIVLNEAVPGDVLAKIQQHALGINPDQDYPRDEFGQPDGTRMTPEQLERYAREQQSQEARTQPTLATSSQSRPPDLADQQPALPATARGSLLIIQLVRPDGSVQILATHQL